METNGLSVGRQINTLSIKQMRLLVSMEQFSRRIILVETYNMYEQPLATKIATHCRVKRIGPEVSS